MILPKIESHSQPTGSTNCTGILWGPPRWWKSMCFGTTNTLCLSPDASPIRCRWGWHTWSCLNGRMKWTSSLMGSPAGTSAKGKVAQQHKEKLFQQHLAQLGVDCGWISSDTKLLVWSAWKCVNSLQNRGDSLGSGIQPRIHRFIPISLVVSKGIFHNIRCSQFLPAYLLVAACHARLWVFATISQYCINQNRPAFTNISR